MHRHPPRHARTLFRNRRRFVGGFGVRHVHHPFLRGLRAWRFIALVRQNSKANLQRLSAGNALAEVGDRRLAPFLNDWDEKAGLMSGMR
jgi:hypothetical protein